MMSNTFPVPMLRYQGIRKLFTASIFAADPPQTLFLTETVGFKRFDCLCRDRCCQRPLSRSEPSFVDLVRDIINYSSNSDR